jgi:PAS domain S-box-containing protein
MSDASETIMPPGAAQVALSLRNIAQAILAGISPAELGRELSEHIRTALHPDCTLFFRAENQDLTLQFSWLCKSIVGNRAEKVKVLGRCLCERAAGGQKPVYAADVAGDSGCGFDHDGNPDIRSFVALPILGSGELLGVIGIGSLNLRDFQPDRPYLETLGDMAALAFHCSRLGERSREGEEKFSKLATAVEHAAESIVVTDPRGRIQYVNPSFENVSGYRHPEVIGLRVQALESCENREPRDQVLEMVRRGKIWRGRLISRAKDGHRYEEEATISPVRDGKGSIINFVEVRRDITREAMLEQQLQQAQKMEAIGTLAGGIAHDFNNILAAILGYTELARMDLDGNPRVMDNLDRVLQASHRARELVAQILAFSRQAEQEKRPVHISSVVKEALKLMRASLPSTIEIRQHIREDLGNVLADPTQIHQVLMNICSNAGHAMRECGGTLQVTLDHPENDPEFDVHFPSEAASNYLRLTISDTGHGMSSDVQRRIFDPYFTTKTKGEGTGLGLAVVHGIVKSHNGHIAVESTAGEGSTFRIYLPRILVPTLSLHRASVGSIPNGNECILLVDDEAEIAQMERQMLERLGYRVFARSDSVRALADFRQDPGRFDLVVTDMTMPKLTGDQLAAQIRRIAPNIPIILCTGFSERVDSETARRIGVSEFLLKPLALEKLARTIRRLLDDGKAG